ncbi:MAG: hypothetical protein JXL97_08355 [Bacteroidales bacterium]|nr:hypothetical protein [Bacteroidales bacterium]
MNNSLKYILAFVFVFFSILFFNLDIYSSLGVGLFVFFGTKFFIEIGQKIEIRDVMIILAALQWIIGPMLAFIFYPDDEFYYMAVNLQTYMGFVVPATYTFAIGMYLPFWKKIVTEKKYLNDIRAFFNKNKNIDIVFILIGTLSELFIEIVPANIRFVLFLFSGLRFIGLYFLLLSDRKYKRVFIIIIIGWLFFVSLRESLFHDLLLWLGFFVIIAAFINKPKQITKFYFIFGIVLLSIVIQTVKFSYREAINEGVTGSKMNLFARLVKDKVIETDYATSESNLSAMVVRINQGWIIARIMRWTPEYEPFAKGETIITAIEASFMPRFLFPNKVRAGGRTYFERFTGKRISDETSMGLGLLGEAYANYGIRGGAFFMLMIGLFYNFFLSRIYKIALKHPAIIFFIPLLFLQVVKAETDFSVILNHLIKASVVVWAIFFGLRKFFKIKI